MSSVTQNLHDSQFKVNTRATLEMRVKGPA